MEKGKLAGIPGSRFLKRTFLIFNLTLFFFLGGFLQVTATDYFKSVNPASEGVKYERGYSDLSQPKKITGKVIDGSGISLPGVTVVVKGTTTGTITGPDGEFTLSGIPENATLQFSFVGMWLGPVLLGLI
jgi:hypothetical protein